MNFDLEQLGPEIRTELRERLSREHGEVITANFLLEGLLNRQLVIAANLQAENAELLRVIAENKRVIEEQRVALGGRPRRRKGDAVPPEG